MGNSMYKLDLNDIFGCTYEKKPSNVASYIDDTSRTKVYKIDIPGVDADKVTITKKWINRTKRLTLKVLIGLGDDVFHTEVIDIDTNLYNKYTYEVKNGRITITLYEIINPEPEFELV